MKVWLEALAGLALTVAWLAVSAAADRATNVSDAAQAGSPPALVQAPHPAANAASGPRGKG
jgi:hypothetical protein